MCGYVYRVEHSKHTLLIHTTLNLLICALVKCGVVLFIKLLTLNTLKMMLQLHPL